MFERSNNAMIGKAPSFRRVLKAAQVVAATDANILVVGESGTGKELLARTIHGYRRQSAGPFITVNCTGLPAEPTDFDFLARRDQAAGGTLFLDEVAELSLSSQARLVRFLENRDGRIDLRIIAATTRDLWSAVDRGEFRRDLYYRLYVVPLELPPLRDRIQDIPLLLEHFGRLIARNHGLEPPHFTATAERLLRRYSWAGNVRELRNFCERMVILFSGREIGPDNLPWEIRRGDTAAEEGIPFKLPATGINLRDLEVEVIRQALALTGGNKSRAARLLGLTRDTLLYRMRKYLIKT